MRRHRAVTIPAGLFAATSLIVLAGALIWSNRWLLGHNARLQVERDRAAGFSRELKQQRDLADRRRIEADRHLYAFRIRQAHDAFRAGRHEKAQVILRDRRPAQGEADLREFAWHYLDREARRHISVLSDREERVEPLALSPDTGLVATGAGTVPFASGTFRPVN